MNSTLILKNYIKEHKISSAIAFALCFGIVLFLAISLIMKLGNLRHDAYTYTIFVLAILISVTFPIWLFMYLGYREIDKSLSNAKTFNDKIDLKTYQKNHANLFGKYISIDVLDLSEEAFKHPMFVWTNERKLDDILSLIIANCRTNKRQLLIFEDEDCLYQKHRNQTDKILNPFIKDGCGWDFFNDFQKNEAIKKYMEKRIMIPCSDYLSCFERYEFSSTNMFLNTLCFSSDEDTTTILESIVQKSITSLQSIRKAMESEFSFLEEISIPKKDISLHDNPSVIWISGFKKTGVKKLSRFILETSPKDSICVVLQKESHNIKRGNTIVLNSSFKEFHIRFDGSLMALGNTENNVEIAHLFGNTSTVGFSFKGKRYHNINKPAVTENDLFNDNNFFKSYENNKIAMF